MDVPGVALVTGSGSGIGRACALTFARDGASGIALLDVNPAALSAVKAEIEQLFPTDGVVNGKGKQVNGSNGDHVNGVNINGEYVNGTNTNGDHVNGEHTNGHHHDNPTSNGTTHSQPQPALPTSKPPRVEIYPVDVSNEDQVNAALASAATTFSRIDYVVNAAGVAVKHPGGVAHATTSDWTRLLNINLTGTFFILRAACKQMLTQAPISSARPSTRPPTHRGSIVNISSIQGVAGIPASAAYAATKAGVLGLTRSASEDYAGQGIRVNAVCPGYTETPLTMADPLIREAMRVRVEGAVPMGRMAGADEIADAVVYLCGGRSSFVAGATVLVDGGYTQR